VQERTASKRVGREMSDTQPVELNEEELGYIADDPTADEAEVVETDEVVLVDLIKDLVDGLPTVDQITPYQVHNVVNTVLEVLGSAYRVRPQMMYNYDRNGLIVKGRKGSKRFTSAEVVGFVTRFVNRNISK
jgi:hypothetical protein